MPPAQSPRRKHPTTWQCSLCPKRFTRAFTLRGHLRAHAGVRPFVCDICSVAFTPKHDRETHRLSHTEEKKHKCQGDLADGHKWGCGQEFSLAKNLKRHYRSDKGKICIKPLLDEQSFEHQARALKKPTALLRALEQDFQPHTSEQPGLYHEKVISRNFQPMPWVPIEAGQLSKPQRTILPPPTPARPPTRDEALKAADTVRRYIGQHGLLSTEENGVYGYLELTFKSRSSGVITADGMSVSSFYNSYLGAFDEAQASD